MAEKSQYFAQLRNGESVEYRYEKKQKDIYEVKIERGDEFVLVGFIFRTPSGGRWMWSDEQYGRPNGPFETRKAAAVALIDQKGGKV